MLNRFALARGTLREISSRVKNDRFLIASQPQIYQTPYDEWNQAILQMKMQWCLPFHQIPVTSLCIRGIWVHIRVQGACITPTRGRKAWWVTTFLSTEVRCVVSSNPLTMAIKWRKRTIYHPTWSQIQIPVIVHPCTRFNCDLAESVVERKAWVVNYSPPFLMN